MNNTSTIRVTDQILTHAHGVIPEGGVRMFRQVRVLCDEICDIMNILWIYVRALRISYFGHMQGTNKEEMIPLLCAMFDLLRTASKAFAMRLFGTKLSGSLICCGTRNRTPLSKREKFTEEKFQHVLRNSIKITTSIGICGKKSFCPHGQLINM